MMDCTEDVFASIGADDVDRDAALLDYDDSDDDCSVESLSEKKSWAQMPICAPLLVAIVSWPPWHDHVYRKVEVMAFQ